MLLLPPPQSDNRNSDLLSKAIRDYHALCATAIDAEKCPILSRHWPGPLLIRGQLFCNEDSPLRYRFDSTPAVEIIDPASDGPQGADYAKAA